MRYILLSIIAALLSVLLQAQTPKAERWHLFVGAQVVNKMQGPYEGTRPSAYLLFMVPVKRWAFQYQPFVDTGGTLYHRIGLDFRIR